MALRTALSAEPAPSVPISRSAVKPPIKSSRAAKGGDDDALQEQIPGRFGDPRGQGGGKE